MGVGRDPIAFELFKNAIHSVADEMAVTIFRTAYSSVLKGAMDYSTAICDADARLVAQGLTIPIHLGSIPAAGEAVMRHFGNDIRPGDVYILNDPFDGGMHLPDIFLFQPIFIEGERMAFAAAICHHTDVGGRVAGSNAADSTEVYQEGLRISPLKYYEEGVRNEAIHKLIEANVRVPVLVFGDMRAQLAACHTADQGFRKLIDDFGRDAVRDYMGETIAYSERMARAAIGELPDGVFAFEDWIDDDGVDLGRPIRLKVTFAKAGGSLRVDWAGTSPQVKGAINSTFSCAKSAVYCALKCILTGDIPPNEGFFRSVDIVAPEATIVSAVLPAATAARALTCFRMLDCCFGALARMLPERVFAASDGGNVGVAVGGYDADRSPFIYVDFAASAWGGRPFADGVEGNSNIFSNNAGTSVEMVEAEVPLRIHCYELVADTAGPGRFRGGVAMRRDHELLEDAATLQMRTDRRAFRPYGLYGGGTAAASLTVLNPAGATGQVLEPKLTREIARGEVFRYQTAGAGGWGDPLERAPWRVLKDVRNGYVSAAAAHDQYGVVIDTATWAVDEAVTAMLRDELRAGWGWTEPPFVDRGPLPEGIAPEA